MLEFQEKKRIRKIIYSKKILVFLGIVLLVLLNATAKAYMKNRETAKNKEISEIEMNELKSKETELVTQIDKLKTDRGVEEEIRKKFRVVKGDEDVVIIVEDAKPTSTEKEGGFLGAIKRFFRF